MTQLVFILSLPRSGSTWLQRILAGSDDVQTVAEPWFLLPLIYGVIEARGYAEYHQSTYGVAVADLTRALPNGCADLDEAVRSFAAVVYGKLARGAPIFVDKTPRYALVLNQLMRIFPEAKFIILFRDPVDVAISLCRSFGGRWNTLFRYEIDFYRGLPNLCSAANSGAENVFVLRYEKMIEDPELALSDLSRFLSFEVRLADEHKGARKVLGSVGDPFRGRNGLDRPLSRGEWRMSRQLILDVPDKYFDVMGYMKDQSLEKLSRVRGKWNWRDPVSFVAMNLYKAGLIRGIERVYNRHSPRKSRPEFGVE